MVVVDAQLAVSSKNPPIFSYEEILVAKTVKTEEEFNALVGCMRAGFRYLDDGTSNRPRRSSEVIPVVIVQPQMSQGFVGMMTTHCNMESTVKYLKQSKKARFEATTDFFNETREAYVFLFMCAPS